MNIPEKVCSWAVFALSIVASVGGVAWAVISNHPLDGGRGGAIGTAIALAFMFINRDYGYRIYKAMVTRAPARAGEIAELRNGAVKPPASAAITPDQVKSELDTFVAAVVFDAGGQQTQNTFLAIATFISTILWGFGDKLADWLINVCP